MRCAALLAFLLAAVCGNLVAQNDTCIACHDQGPKLEKSGHAGLACDVCHQGHGVFPHPQDVPKPMCVTCHTDQAADYTSGVHGQARQKGNEAAPDCGVCHGSAHEVLRPQSAAFRDAITETCGLCHGDVAQQFRASVHGQALARGETEAPRCIDCHGGHKILKPVDQGSAAHVRETCGGCHGNVRLAQRFGMPTDRLISFDSSFHGLAAKAGSQTVASCASCHGVHNILPSSDPNSTIAPKNLPTTCGKCHPGAGTRFAISEVHLVEGRSESAGTVWVRRIYMVLIPMTLGFMFLHNAGDWVRKLIRARFGTSVPVSPKPLGAGEMRMLPFERIQHALLAISFIILTWTGFALKYPDQWWAQPLLWMEGTRSARSLIHRIAAAVFLATAAAHILSLILNPKLRDHWKHLLPGVSDAREVLSGFAYNLGLRSQPAVRSSHSYVEKIEYFGLVWGGIVMAITGVLLWANNLALRFLPKTWLDVATSVHFYEAILAAAVIVVWHFYYAILDPDVYPLDTAFLTGFKAGKPPASEDQTP